MIVTRIVTRERVPSTPGPIDPDLQKVLDRAGHKEPDVVYRCRHCGHEITRRAACIDVAGQHVHVCVNPYGFEFRIGCFASANGVRVTGTAIAEHTWFSGYAWQIAHCAGCHRHCGWFFSGGLPFFGLILAHLTEEKL